jgi:hypothetical protein
MAAGLGFKTFLTGDVLTAADTNGYLMQGVWVFASAAARDAAVTSPQEGNFCYLKDTNATQYYTGSAWTAVGGGGGKVLQVVMGSTATTASNSTTTPADTGLTATITPSSATSKVLVLVSQQGCYKSAGTSTNSISLKLLRGATTIQQIATNLFYNTTVGELSGSISSHYLDSPATTSATTYKTQFYNYVGAASVSVQIQNVDLSTIILLEIGA